MLAWRPLVGLAAILAAALLLTAAPGWAHSDPPQPSLAGGPAPAAVPADAIGSSVDRVGAEVFESSLAIPRPTPLVMSILGLCLAVAALCLLPRCPRRLTAALLAMLVTIVVIESSLHAVHHLGDPDGAAHCSVASVTSHLSGTVDPPHTAQPAFVATTDHLIVLELLSFGTRPLSPQRGRAPPSLAS